MFIIVLLALVLLPFAAVLLTRSFWAGVVVMVASVMCGGVLVHGLVQRAHEELSYLGDCRLVGGCTPDVITDWCAPSPSTCPSARQVDASGR